MRHNRCCYLLLFDVLVENLGDLVRTLLRVPLLTALVIHVRNAKACRVAFGPFEVAADTLLALHGRKVNYV